MTDQYATASEAARRAEGAVATATDAWADSVQRAAEGFRLPALPLPQLPQLPQLPTDPTAFVTQWFDLTDRLTQVNREYALNLAGVVNSLGGAVRQHVDGLGQAFRDGAQAASDTTREQLQKVADAEREQAEEAARIQREQAEQAEREQREAEQAQREAEREQAREARNAERQKARQERQAARQRYEGLTKAELTEELSRRELPKTGTVDELVERLVDADTK